MTDANPAYAIFERAVNKRRLSNRIAAVVITLISVVAVFWGFSATGDRSMARMAAHAVALLREAATEATAGHSEERRVKFRAQPESLRIATGTAS